MRTVQAARRGPRTFHPDPELRTLEDLVPKCSSAVVVLVDAGPPPPLCAQWPRLSGLCSRARGGARAPCRVCRVRVKS